MPADALPARDWYRALTLAERAELWARISSEDPQGGASGEGTPGTPEDTELARHRLSQWRDLSAFRTDGWLARRLAQDGLDETSFPRLVGEPAESLASRLTETPPWITELEGALAAAGDGEPLPLPEPLRDNATAGFLELVRPLAQRARRRLREGIARILQEYPGAPFDPAEVERGMSEGLPYRLLPLLSRTLVLELNVARVQGLLPGDTPEERFAAFVARLRDRETTAAILREYPVLARTINEDLDLWVEASLEILDHLAADWADLVTTFFGGNDPGPLASLDGGAGDRHRGGRAVRILSFAGGKLVYKPRPLAVDVHFQDLLDWLNERGDHPAFRTLRVLDRGDHGWVEFVEAGGCAAAGEVALYHRRLGGQLALLHALEATDFHYENLIAAGDQPVLVDLESLFHPRVPRPETKRPDERLANRELERSVLRVGLLPFRIGESDDFEGADISGVARVAGQQTPHPVIQWQAIGTDEMHVIRDRVVMEGGRNRPTLEDEEVEAADFVDEMAAGFAEVYRLLARHRDELLAPGGLVERFADAPVRAVLRPTQLYGLLLMEANHPDVLRDALDRDLLFDRLWVGIDDGPALARVIPAEHRELCAGDIPSFSARPGSADVWTSSGERIPDFFEEPPLAAVRRRLLTMDEDDLRRQSWLLRLSLGTRKLNDDAVGWTRYTPVAPEISGEPLPAAELRQRLLSGARAVGDWFAEMAIREGRYATWIGLEFREKRWSMVPLPEDLYSGLPGVALFLGYLGALTGEASGEAEPTRLARQAMNSLVARLAGEGTEKVPTIGAFQGWGGVLYAAAHLARLWDDRELLTATAPMLGQVAAQIDQDEDLDMVGGAAGAIASLLALHEAGSARALETAVRCGERLLATARPERTGLGWLTRLATERPQIGFSHGVAGIGLALLRLGTATGDERFTRAGLQGFAWEREAFWPELRRWLGTGGERPPLESTVAMAWCYGAPGVGLARLEALTQTQDAELRNVFRAEVDDAVRLTLERGFGQNHCLCHGDLGNLDFLLQAEQRLDLNELRVPIARQAEAVLADIERHGWRCGTRGEVESPALMNGYAGIGYGLLRLAEPGRVPSVLALAPPLSRAHGLC
jgi:type 2 lantibiotic biosynthesis protein LanM